MKTGVMYSPCANCPFRIDCPAFLSKGRAREIMRALKKNRDFHCHKTVDYSGDDGEGFVTSASMICAGFAIIAENEGHPTQMMRICERLRLYDPQKLDRTAPVHKTAKAFIGAQR